MRIVRLPFLLLLPLLGDAFSLITQPCGARLVASRLGMTDGNESAEELVLGDAAKAELAKIKSKYPTSEADYLAAARARSAAKMKSTERQATDEELQKLAAEKRAQMGDIDEWEESAKEAGNADSQILIPMASEESDGKDSDEPKLMLF